MTITVNSFISTLFSTSYIGKYASYSCLEKFHSMQLTLLLKAKAIKTSNSDSLAMPMTNGYAAVEKEKNYGIESQSFFMFAKSSVNGLFH